MQYGRASNDERKSLRELKTMRCRSLADRSFSASLPSSRELRVGSPCDNAKPQGNHLMANAVGKLKAIDGLFAQERCLRGLGTRETDQEREQIRDASSEG